MATYGEKILINQNKDEPIKLLACQRVTYSQAKIYFYIQCILAIPIPIIISLVGKYYKIETDELAWIFSLYLILNGIGYLYFEKQIKHLKGVAAGIQELFDCRVLNIEWNSTLVSKKPSSEFIDNKSLEFFKTNDNSKLLNWYSKKISPLNSNLSTLICQSTNCTYDAKFRKLVNFRLLLIALFTFLVILVVSAFNDLTLKSFFTNVLIPSLPVFLLAWKVYITNNENLQELIDISNKIDKHLSNKNINSNIDDIEIRKIQDRIYHSRKSRNLLPDWVFFKFRKKLEKSMDYLVVEKINELN